MSVDVGGHLDIRVARVLLNVLEGRAAVQQEAGATVAELVETDMRQTRVKARKCLVFRRFRAFLIQGL